MVNNMLAFASNRIAQLTSVTKYEVLLAMPIIMAVDVLSAHAHELGR